MLGGWEKTSLLYLSYLLRKCDSLHILEHDIMISFRGALVEIYVISALSRLGSDFTAKTPVILVHLHLRDYQSVALMGCRDFRLSSTESFAHDNSHSV